KKYRYTQPISTSSHLYFQKLSFGGKIHKRPDPFLITLPLRSKKLRVTISISAASGCNAGIILLNHIKNEQTRHLRIEQKQKHFFESWLYGGFVFGDLCILHYSLCKKNFGLHN